MSNPPLDEILARLEAARRILIFSHVGPDGDALGSALGLMWLLRGRGKEATVSFEDPLPSAFRFLPGSGEVANRSAEGYDLVVALDGSDEERYGKAFSDARSAGSYVIGIDHHKTNTGFATLGWVDSAFTATAQMILHLARAANWELSQAAATCLATGCVTDTNAFSTDHTTPAVLEDVADLMRRGAPLATIIRQAMSLHTPADARLWGRVLSTVEIDEGVAWALNRAGDRAAVGASEEDGGGITTFLRDVIGVNVSLLFIEVEERLIRLSMRARPGYDVGTLAYSLGGGGHTLAAGATLQMGLEEAVAHVVPLAAALDPYDVTV